MMTATDPQHDILEAVIRSVAQIYGLAAEQVTGSDYSERAAEARAMAMTEAVRHVDMHLWRIARRFDRRTVDALHKARTAYERHHATDRDGFRGKLMTLRRLVREATT